MSNDLVKQAANTGLSFLAGGANPFSSMMAEYNVPSGAFLKFSGNTGQFTYKGQIIEHGSTFAFNMIEMKRGWVCWKDKKVADQHMVRVLSNDQPPEFSELKDYGPYREGEGWSEQVGVPVRDLEGGEQLEMNLSSIGGRNALVRLADEFGQKVRMNMDEEGNPKVPIVEITAQSFESQKAAGTKWAPIFKIVDWMSVEELSELANAAGNPADEQDGPTSGAAASESDADEVNQQSAPQQSAARVQQAASDKPMSTRKTGMRPGRRM